MPWIAQRSSRGLPLRRDTNLILIDDMKTVQDEVIEGGAGLVKRIRAGGSVCLIRKLQRPFSEPGRIGNVVLIGWHCS